MKKWRDSSFRVKLCVSNVVAITLVVVAIVLLMAMTASRETSASNRIYLQILTEQALSGFTDTVRNMDQSLYNLCNGIGVPTMLFNMRGLEPESHEYDLARRDLQNILSLMVAASMPYENVAILPDDHQELIFSNNTEKDIRRKAEEIFDIPEHRNNTYGHRVWTKLADGSLWEIWDVYHVSPLRHVARIAGQVRSNWVISSDWASELKDLTMLFLNQEGQVMFETGKVDADLVVSLRQMGNDLPETCDINGISYATTVRKNGEWTAIGLQPTAVIDGVSRHLNRIAVMALTIGVILAVGFAFFFSKGMTGRIGVLVDSMNRVAEGDLDVVVPVEGNDEIGIITEHFNRMTGQTKELLNRVVQEEANKQQAEYQNLEYEYRFLAWQINPHFIYNALETVNALAKIDGNQETCQMIQLLSAYFRRNAENMRTRFLTVRNEFDDLRQYVEIYRQIYGPRLEVTYEANEVALKAYLPSMILQALLENALVHGINPDGNTVIRIRGEIRENELILSISDNGPGMSDETMARIMGPRPAEPHGVEQRTSLGVRNVMDRLQLLYGNNAEMKIQSSAGEGTTVTIRVPLRFDLGQSKLVATEMGSNG